MRSVSQLKGAFSFAMHGAGAIYGCTHTNTKEAFRFWYDKGIKIFEIDVGIDDNYEDGIAFAHFMEREGDWLHKEVIPSRIKADYKSNAIYPRSTNGLSILLLSEVFSYLREDSDLLIMFDFWGGWNYDICCRLTQLIVNEVGNHPELWNRLLIEVYTKEMIQAVQEIAPKANMIFGESYLSNSVTIEQIKLSGISYVSFPRDMARKNLSKFQGYVNQGFTIFSLSSSSFGWKKWMSKGINVSIVDIKYDSLFQIIPFLFLSFRHKLNVMLVGIEYYGFKRSLQILTEKLFR